MAKKETPAEGQQNGGENPPETERDPLEQPSATESGAVQVTEDEQGAQFARVADVEGLRTENMPTQAQVQVANAAAVVNANRDEGLKSISADSASTTVVYPMQAVTHVVVGLNTYGPGQFFSVGEKDVRDSLIAQKVAIDRALKASEDPRPDDPSRYNTGKPLTI